MAQVQYHGSHQLYVPSSHLDGLSDGNRSYLLLYDLSKQEINVRTTYIAKPGEVERKWYVVDATDVPLGRLSTVVQICRSL